jgi:pimeloyl-ACP methyl ester carboxylesterase
MIKFTHLERLNRHRLPSVIIGMLLLVTFAPLQAKIVTQQFRGLTINANLEIAENSNITEGVVLILHGVMSHSGMEILDTSQQALLDNGKNSLAINLSLSVDNRKGFYSCASPHRHLQDNALDEITAWVAWLRQKSVKQIVLLTHSRGANQAMVYAAVQVDPEITHLVMLAPGVDDSPQRFESRYGSTFNATLERVKKEKNAGRGNQLLENVDFWYCPKATVTPDSFLSYYGENSRFRKVQYYIPKIEVPTLVVIAGADQLVQNAAAKLAPFVESKQIQLVTIEGSGHFFLDFNIEEAIEAMIEFLDETG